MSINIKLLKIYSDTQIIILKEQFGKENVFKISTKVLGIVYNKDRTTPKYNEIINFISDKSIDVVIIFLKNYLKIMKRFIEDNVENIEIRTIKNDTGLEEIFDYYCKKFIELRENKKEVKRLEEMFYREVGYHIENSIDIKYLKVDFLKNGIINEVFIYSNGIISMTYFSEDTLLEVGRIVCGN